MKALIRNLESLDSIQVSEVDSLNELGIYNVGELLSHKLFRAAQLIEAARDGELKKDDILTYLDDKDEIRNKDINDILFSSIENIKEIGQAKTMIYNLIGIYTIYDAANYPPFLEAKNIIDEILLEENDPSAPECLIPKCKKFSKDIKKYVSFFREKEMRDVSVICTNNNLPLNSIFDFGDEEPTIYLGYTTSYIQEWIFEGTHLGEPVGSVPLFMGQDTKVTKIGWQRINRAIRQENTQVAETLHNLLIHNRAVDEVARATANEHQHGATSTVAANAATAESFVAAGAVVGGVGGGITGAITGLVVGNVANAAGGAPTIAGTVAGTALGSAAGAAAGSMLYSGAVALGFVESDAQGTRGMHATSAQHIQERTAQNSSSIRSFWSNIISEVVEKESQEIKADRITNYNKIHALNGMYYEVLNEYSTTIKANDYKANIFIPYAPFNFDEDLLFQYWWIIKQYIEDKNLVDLLDQRYIGLNASAGSGANLQETFPDIDDIKTRKIEVKLDVDGSAMETLVESLAWGTVVAIGTILKLSNIRVEIDTTDGIFPLEYVDTDANYVVRFQSYKAISISSIKTINIKNSNFEFFGLNKTVFSNATIQASIRDKQNLKYFLPNIGELEVNYYLYDSQFEIGANRTSARGWVVVSDLDDQYNKAKSQWENKQEIISEIEQVDRKIYNFINYLNSNKYTFTRLILQNIEKEQLSSILNDVEVGGIPLNTIADTTPVGFTGSHIVVELKKPVNAHHYGDPFRIKVDRLYLDLMPLETLQKPRFNQMISKSNKKMQHNTTDKNHLNSLQNEISSILKKWRSDNELSYKEKKFLKKLEKFDFLLAAAKNSKNSINLNFIIDEIIERASDVQFFVKNIRHMTLEQERFDIITQYFDDIKEYFADNLNKTISSERLSLPSPALFLEPILSNAKGAELYDMRRNSHYDILQSSEIAPTDPNINRNEDIQLTPNQPAASLNVVTPPQYPIPNTINTAMTEAGKLDLSTMINTNASTLTSTLTNLSNLATELAKASSQLTGDAKAQALSTAGDVAKQIGGIIEKTLKAPTTTHTNKTKPDQSPPIDQRVPAPKTQQEKAEVVREVQRLRKSHNPKKVKDEQVRNITPVSNEDTYNAQNDATKVFTQFTKEYIEVLKDTKDVAKTAIEAFNTKMQYDDTNRSLSINPENFLKLFAIAVPELKLGVEVADIVIDVYNQINADTKEQLSMQRLDNFNDYIINQKVKILHLKVNPELLVEMLVEKWREIDENNKQNAVEFLDYFRQGAAIDEIRKNQPNFGSIMINLATDFINCFHKERSNDSIPDYFGVLEITIHKEVYGEYEEYTVEDCHIVLEDGFEKYAKNLKNILSKYGNTNNNKLDINKLSCYKHIKIDSGVHTVNSYVDIDPSGDIIEDISGFDFEEKFKNEIPGIPLHLC